MQIAKRMVPGSHADTRQIIGNCHYCGKTVDYSAGDLALDGQARHDSCESTDIRTKHAAFNAKLAYLSLLSDHTLPKFVREGLLATCIEHFNTLNVPAMKTSIDMLLPKIDLIGSCSLIERRRAVTRLRDVRRMLHIS
jgi:hypothetical protein